MIERIHRLWWRAALPLIRRVGSLPAGIWFVWACLAYAARTLILNLQILALPGVINQIQLYRAVISWLILIIAAVALFRRRLISRMFCGMSMLLLFMHALYRLDPFGISMAILCIPCLLANRRWFYERLPNIW